MHTIHSTPTDLQVKFDMSVLRLPVEILEILVNFIASWANNDDTRRALHSLVFTCRWLSNIALDELWGRFQYSLVPLVELFSTFVTQKASVSEISLDLDNILRYIYFSRAK